jgi:hypothetical protein
MLNFNVNSSSAIRLLFSQGIRQLFSSLASSLSLQVEANDFWLGHLAGGETDSLAAHT